jgi:hypothetical protein
VAYLLGAVVLARRLSARVGGHLEPLGVPSIAALSALVGLVLWWGARLLENQAPGRLVQAVATGLLAAAAAGAVVGAYRLMGFPGRLTPRVGAAPEALG